MEEVLTQIMTRLYGGEAQQLRVAVAELRQQLPQIDENNFEPAIELLAQRGLIRLSLNRDAVILVPAGKVSQGKGCVLETCLGRQYILQKYRRAIVHISIMDGDGDEHGGAGFFSTDFPGFVATAGHIVKEGHRILSIRDEHDGIIAEAGFGVVRLRDANLDIALVRCNIPDGINPLKIDWEPTSPRELDEIVVGGYPFIAGHQPALVFSEGIISAFASQQRSEKKSIIISRLTEPGFSGGPVIDNRGFVVGVVEEEKIFTDRQGKQSIFVGATPAHYFREAEV